MRLCPAEKQKALMAGLHERLRDALCLRTRNADDSKAEAGSLEAQRGSAVVEFTFLSLLLMVPVIYFVVTMGQIQGGSFAVVGAADQAAKVFVTYGDPAGGRAAAERTVLTTLKDFGHSPDQASVDIACDRQDCLSAGALVTVTVSLDVPLPMMPFGDAFTVRASRVSASATQIVGRFQ